MHSPQTTEVHTERIPLISVIITGYNHAHFLGEAIESVTAQTFQDFEIVMIDDGSTDSTAEVVARYPQVHYVRQTNQGLSAARNTGIRQSNGRYLLFLDADDRILPQAIEVGLNCFATNPDCAFVSGRYCFITEDGVPIPGTGKRPLVTGDHYHAFLSGNYIGMHATVIYRRQVIEKLGGFDTRLPACEDYDLYLRISREFRVATHEELVAEYRMHGSNMSGDLGLMLGTVLRVLKRQRHHIIHDPAMRVAFRKGLENWRWHYTEKMLERLNKSDRASRDFKKVASLAWTFFRLAPGTMIQQGSPIMKTRIRSMLRRHLPAWLRRRLKRSHSAIPQVGSAQFGDFRRLTPLSRCYGFDRGLPIDRYYIEAFLTQQAKEIQGRVLEIGGNDYTLRFGARRVTKGDVLHVNEGNPQATFVGDLAKGENLPSDVFDCIILTQTLHLIYEVRAALATLHRILKPGGMLLMTVPGTISQLEEGVWNTVWHWGFTGLSIRKLCEEQFSSEAVNIRVHGNVFTSVAFLEGVAAEELRAEELAFQDPLYPLLITVRAQKTAH